MVLPLLCTAQALAADGDQDNSIIEIIPPQPDVDLKNWMSTLPDDWYINEINIPGTHDSGTKNVAPPVACCFTDKYAKCQDLSIDQQLNIGIRVFDIRVNGVSGDKDPDWHNLILRHGPLNCKRDGHVFNLYLTKVLDWCDSFLKDHPLETIILIMQAEGDDQDEAKQCLRQMYDEFNAGSKYVYYLEGDKVPTLGEVRGKIVFMDNELDQGTNTAYENHYCFSETENKVIYVRKALSDAGYQDFFTYRGNFCNQEDTIHNDAGYEGEPVIKEVYTSGNGAKDMYTYIEGVPGPSEFAADLNRLLFRKISFKPPYSITYYDWRPGVRYGWIMMDFPGGDTVGRIIATNDESRYLTEMNVKVEWNDGREHSKDLTYTLLEKNTGRVVDNGVRTWIADDEIHIDHLYCWNGRYRNQYIIKPDVPDGWTYDFEDTGEYTDDGVKIYKLSLNPPEKVNVTVKWDCYPNHSRQLSESLKFRSYFMVDPKTSKDIDILSQEIISDNQDETVFELQLNCDYKRLLMHLDLVDTSSSDYTYDPAVDKKQWDNHHYEYTLHFPGEYVTVSGLVVWDDDGNSRKLRPAANSNWWDSITISGKTSDSTYYVESKAIVARSERSKDTATWTASVPKVSPYGKELSWTVKTAGKLTGYNKSIGGVSLKMTPQEFLNVHLNWKNDTEDVRPQNVFMFLYTGSGEGKRYMGVAEATSGGGWTSTFLPQLGDTMYYVEPHLPDGYSVYYEAYENGVWEIYINYSTPEGGEIPEEYEITITDGTASHYAAQAGETIYITANEAPEGKTFTGWESVSENVVFGDASKIVTSFVMPAEPVEVKAVYEDITDEYEITVNGGSSSYGSAEPGTRIILIPDPAPEGKEFDRWNVIEGDAVLENDDSAVSSFLMPEGNVLFEAVYKDIVVPEETFVISIDYGFATPNVTTKGTKVIAKANPANDWEEFDHWEVASGSVKLADDRSPETTFIMPEENVELNAVFKLKTFKIIEGNDSSWTKKSGKVLKITCDGLYEAFDKLLVDGKELNKEYYSVKEGSTIVTLSSEYLETLSEGKHKIVFAYDIAGLESLSETGTFTVAAEHDTPTTGDSSNIFGLMALLLISAAVCAAAVIVKRRFQ